MTSLASPFERDGSHIWEHFGNIISLSSPLPSPGPPVEDRTQRPWVQGPSPAILWPPGGTYFLGQS